MTVKTPLSFNDRRHRYIEANVAQDVFTSSSVTIAACEEHILCMFPSNSNTRKPLLQ